ncbi:hypothetical protein RRG08_023411 [Elysia crispata]|uniref:Uncharacterized protein n=1 Tax=Elysia crispata TaxID=231223 RepID=A0AAE0YE98_9GAST|nr:hypothetical protein RRG08_023411 [Elysia crispata]
MVTCVIQVMIRWKEKSASDAENATSIYRPHCLPSIEMWYGLLAPSIALIRPYETRNGVLTKASCAGETNKLFITQTIRLAPAINVKLIPHICQSRDEIVRMNQEATSSNGEWILESMVRDWGFCFVPIERHFWSQMV